LVSLIKIKNTAAVRRIHLIAGYRYGFHIVIRKMYPPGPYRDVVILCAANVGKE
jgi:hypothetical protein